MKRIIIIIVIMILVVIISIIGRGAIINHVLPWLNPLNWGEAWSDFWAKEYTLAVQLHGSYEIDTSGIKEYERIKRKYEDKQEDEPFVYLLQLRLENSIMDSALKDLNLSIPDELLIDMATYDEDDYVLLAFGRELKEIKYKTTSYYNRIKAKITFCEEHQDDTVYVYFMEDNIFFWETSYYVMEGTEKVHIGDHLFYTYN